MITLKTNLKSLVFEFNQEPVEGKIVIKSATSISHQAIRLSVNGSVNLQVSDSLSIEAFLQFGSTKLVKFLPHSYRFVEDQLELSSPSMVSSSLFKSCKHLFLLWFLN